MGSSPSVELFRIVLGIDSDGPGFQKVGIRPHLGKLSQVRGKIPHPNGEVSVNYYQVKSKWKAEIILPKNTTGTFYWKEKSFDLKSNEKTTLDL